MVQAPRQGCEPSPAHPAVGGFQPDDAAQGGRNPDAAAGVAAHGDRTLAGRGGGPAASAGTAGNPFRVPGIVHVPIVAILTRRAKGQRVHIEFADEDGPGLAEPGGDRAVPGGDVVVVNARARRSADAGGLEEVF